MAVDGNNIVEQALEVAKVEAEAELAHAEAEIKSAESLEHSIQAVENQETPISDAVQVAEIEAQRDIAVAEIVATSQDNTDQFAVRFAELEGRLQTHETAMRLEIESIRKLVEQHHPNDVEQVPVKDVKEKLPKTEKKEEKPKFGKLFLGTVK